MKRDIRRCKPRHRLAIAALNRKQHPGVAGAAEDGVVVPDGSLAGEHYSSGEIARGMPSGVS